MLDGDQIGERLSSQSCDWDPGTVSAGVGLQHGLFDKVTKPSCQAGRTVLQEMADGYSVVPDQLSRT